jgi:hypothetical protein
VTDPGEWHRVRAYLQQHRHELSASAAARYPAADRAEDTDLLTATVWRPAAPLPLEAIELSWAVAAPAGLAPAAGGRDAVPAADGWDAALAADGWDAALAAVLPDRADGLAYRRYSAAVADLAAPAIFADRRTYRLTGADLTGSRGALAFGPGTFFQGYDVGAAVAHEHAAAVLGVLAREDLRALVGDPRELARRPANLAISTLTLRADGAAATFPLHWRDPALVGHAGGLYQVIPVGIFQAADDGPASQAQDFDLWRGMTREFAEELLGMPEDYGPAGTAVDYGGWPFARQLTAARAGGSVRPWVLGLGVDPLTLATDLLTAVVIDAPVFDELFGAMVSSNAEGRVRPGLAFTAETVGRVTAREPIQAAGAALLRLAWRHRAVLLPG